MSDWVEEQMAWLIPHITEVYGASDLALLTQQRDRHQPNDNGDDSVGCSQCGGIAFPCMERVAFDRLVGQAGGEREEPDW